MKKIQSTAIKHCLSFLLLTFFLVSAAAQAGQNAKAVPLKGASYTFDWPMDKNINHFKDKKVTVYLRSGASFTGWVKKINQSYVHIDNLKGRDFHDALILTSEIVAISTAFRGYPDN